MAIPTPTVPSTENPISAVDLRQTQNGKSFYINSGVIGADDTETTIISVNDVGKRDILICVNPFNSTATADFMTFRVKNNGETIYQQMVFAKFTTGPLDSPPSPIHFIIPANTSIEITFQNSDSTVHNVGVSAYGYYLEGPHYG